MFCCVVIRGWTFCLDGVLLGGQAVGVPAHRVQDVEAVHPLEAGQDVGGGVPFGVADVQPGPAGVGEHVEDVVLRLARGCRVRPGPGVRKVLFVSQNCCHRRSTSAGL